MSPSFGFDEASPQSDWSAFVPPHFGGRMRVDPPNYDTAIQYSTTGTSPNVNHSVNAGRLVIATLRAIAVTGGVAPTFATNASFSDPVGSGGLAGALLGEESATDGTRGIRVAWYAFIAPTAGTLAVSPATVTGANNLRLSVMAFNSFSSSITAATLTTFLKPQFRITSGGVAGTLFSFPPALCSDFGSAGLLDISCWGVGGVPSAFGPDGADQFASTVGQQMGGVIAGFRSGSQAPAFGNVSLNGDLGAGVISALAVPPYRATPAPASYDYFSEKAPKASVRPAELREVYYTTGNQTYVNVTYEAGDHVYLFVTSTDASPTPPAHNIQAGFTLIGTTTVVDGSTSARTSVAKYIAGSSGTSGLTPFGTSAADTRMGAFVVVGASAASTPTLAITSSVGGSPNPPSVATADGALVLLYGFLYDASGGTGSVEPPWGVLDDFDWLTANRGVMGAHTVARGITAYDSGAFTPNGNTNYTFGAALSIPSAYAIVYEQGNQIVRSNPTPDWGSSGAGSVLSFAGDVIVRWAITQVALPNGGNNLNYMIGLSETDPDRSYNTIKWAGYQQDSDFQVYELSDYKFSGQPLAIGDYVQVRKTGTTIYYEHAPAATPTTFATVYTSLTPSTNPVLVDLALFNPATIADIQIIDAGVPLSRIDWQKYAGVDITQNFLMMLRPASYSITGSPVSLKLARRVVPTNGSYALTGSPITLKLARRLVPVAGSYTLTGSNVSLRAARRLAPVAGSYSLTGSPVSMYLARRIQPVAGSYALSGSPLGLRLARRIAPAGGAYSLTGSPVALRLARRLVPVAGSYAWSGQSVALRLARVLRPTAGAYALTGSPVALRFGFSITPQGGSYALTGFPITLLRSMRLAPIGGSYALTGAGLGIRLSRVIAIAPGSYLLSGSPLELRAARLLAVQAGALAWSGSPIELRVARRLETEAGSYQLDGSPIAFVRAYTFSPETGQYTLDGFAITVSGARELVLVPGSYTLDGQDINLRRSRQLVITPGAYALTGSPVVLFFTGSEMLVLPGSYSLAGSPIDLLIARALRVQQGIYQLTGSPAGLSVARVLEVALGGYELEGFPVGLSVNAAYIIQPSRTNDSSVVPIEHDSSVRPARRRVLVSVRNRRVSVKPA